MDKCACVVCVVPIVATYVCTDILPIKFHYVRKSVLFFVSSK